MEKLGLCQSQRRREKERERERKRRKAGWQEGGRKGQKERREGGKEVGREERRKEILACIIFTSPSKTQAGCHSIKAITLALLAILEIKFGLLKLYTQKPVG